MSDSWERNRVELDDPIVGWATVTPNDSTDLPATPRAIHVAGGGNVSMTDSQGNTATFVFADGEDKRIRPVRINNTGTTATGIVALY